MYSPLSLPPYPAKTRTQEGRTQILDELRQRYVRLTPEEWVRQHFIHYLITQKGYPAALLANEISIKVGNLDRRCDSVLFHRQGGRPRIIMEYKAPHVSITQKVFQQIYAYNSALHADYLFVSNGMQHYGCHIDYHKMEVSFLKEIPNFTELQ